MIESPTTAEVELLRTSTGCSLAWAKKFLASAEPEFRARLLEAARRKTPRTRVLIDPIESDQSTAEVVRQAAIEAKELVTSRGMNGRGACHAIWREQSRILKEQHGINWYAPSQMNPHIRFD